MNNQIIESEFRKNLQQQEIIFNAHHQFNEKPKAVKQQSQVLMCACGSDIKCEGICREQHLFRVRIANPKATIKGAVGVKSWTNPPNKCPSAYEK